MDRDNAFRAYSIMLALHQVSDDYSYHEDTYKLSRISIKCISKTIPTL